MLQGALVHGVLAHRLTARGAAPLQNVPWNVPVDPDADTARELLRNELSNPIYHQTPSPLERLFTWIQSFFEGLMAPQISGLWAAIAIVAVLLVIGGSSLVISGPVRRNRRIRTTPAVFTDDTRSAGELRLAAHTAAQASDFATAILDIFRALVRRCEERALVEPTPGQTAHEVADTLTTVFPTHSAALVDAALVFDATFYGDLVADRQSYERLRDLEIALATATPTQQVSAL
jgi:Domain of unknown function (DUF4129)